MLRMSGIEEDRQATGQAAGVMWSSRSQAVLWDLCSHSPLICSGLNLSGREVEMVSVREGEGRCGQHRGPGLCTWPIMLWCWGHVHISPAAATGSGQGDSRVITPGWSHAAGQAALGVSVLFTLWNNKLLLHHESPLTF